MNERKYYKLNAINLKKNFVRNYDIFSNLVIIMTNFSLSLWRLIVLSSLKDNRTRTELKHANEKNSY